MGRLLVTGGAYSARSVIAACQRCVNLYPEVNPRDSPVPVTFYQRPGLRKLTSLPGGYVAPGRGLWSASNGQGFYVAGNRVYTVSPTWQLHEIGRLRMPGSTPVSMVDNGIDLMIVDGTAFAATVNLASGTFAQYSDPSFNGADKVDYLDTFVVFNVPQTRLFQSTLSNTLALDPTYVAAKTTFSDRLVTLKVNRHELLLIGAVTTEDWFDAGLPQFPFSETPGVFHQHGCMAKYSVASADIWTYMLSRDLTGAGVVTKTGGYECKRVSNHALEYQIRKMISAGIDVSDAIGYCYQQDGHVFYVLTFPAGDQTWVLDEATSEWHQRGWTDSQGVLHRERANCFAVMRQTLVVGDWENGDLYALDPDWYQDSVTGGPGAIDYIRGFPHLKVAEITGDVPGQTAVASLDGARVQFKQFIADIEVGQAAGTDANPAKVALIWSRDRGMTFGNAVLQSLGAPGEFLTQPQWSPLGIARDMIFELRYSANGPAALNGAWVDAEVAQS